MPIISTLKSSRTRERRALLKEETEAQKLLQERYHNNLEEVSRLHMAVGKVLLNLEVKLPRLELANEKLTDAFEQNKDSEGAEQFQQVLDEDAELIDSVLTKTSELKVLKAELERIRKELEVHSRDPHPTRTSTSDVSIASIWSQPNVQGPIKPPQLEITPFDGDVLKWQEFWDQFEASIDKAHYSPIDKLNYLKSKLKGEALSAISGYQLSNNNYSVVVDVLKRRFGNPQLIIDAHYRSLSHLPAATNQTGSLRQCFDAIERHLRSLEAIGENINHRYFVALISEKLPQKVLYQLYMLKNDDEEWTVSKLRQLLGKHITALEMAGGESHIAQAPVRPISRHPSGHSHYPKSTAGGLLAGNARNSTVARQHPVPKKCIYCGQAHWSDECTKFTTLQARKDKLKGLCYKCLQKGHLLKDCKRDRPCAHCNRPSHHRSLCSKLFEPQSNPPPESQNVSNVIDAKEMILTSGNQVQMQTATSIVKNLSGSSSASVRMILDSGSQRTYITEKLAKDLHLQLNPPERLTVVTFGTEKPRYLQYMPSKLQLILKDGNPMALDVSVVPSITGRITRTPLTHDDATFLRSEGWESKLADVLPVEPDSSPVEMLIGNDYYFDLLLPKKMELRPGLCLFQSRLGWILGGRFHTESNAPEEPTLLISTVGIPPMGIRLTTHMLTTIDSSLLTKPNLERFWNLESLGIAESPLTSDDDQAIDHFNKTVQFTEGRYMVTWPWKDKVPDLPQNYQLAVGRLRSISQKLVKSPALLKQYDDIIKEQLSRGIIEKVTSSSKEGPIKHYIPHHPVITPSKSTTKVRIVYDRDGRYFGISVWVTPTAIP